MEKRISPERTGWRDEELSARHRKWGWDCPATDLDFLLLEYDKGKAVAIIEYKNELAAPQYASHPTYQAMIDLGDRSNLPVFAVRYASDFSWWRVAPLNKKAQEYLPERKEMNEREWIKFLYKLRGYDAPDSLLDGLNIVI